MDSRTQSRMVPHDELDTPDSAVHLGHVYFFFTTADRDEFVSIQHPGGGKPAALGVARDHERRFKPSHESSVRPGPSPVFSRSPLASFLG